jgi:Domain of unknown function (DUF4351)
MSPPFTRVFALGCCHRFAPLFGLSLLSHFCPGLGMHYSQEMLEHERVLILKLLNRRVGALAPELTAQVQTLSAEQLEGLGKALLDFAQPEELAT